MDAYPPFAELLANLRQGEPWATEAVWERFARRLVAFAAARLPDKLRAKTDPEDIVQSVFRSFFARQASDRFTLENWDSLWNLLTVLTVRKCGHRVRHYQAACRDVRREAVLGPETVISDTNSQAVDPEPDPIEAMLLADTLQDLLDGLKPDQRSIVQLRLEGLSIKEISRRMSCTERTVHRVLEKVRAHLENGADLDGPQ